MLSLWTDRVDRAEQTFDDEDQYLFDLIIFATNQMKMAKRFYRLQMMSKRRMNSENYQSIAFVYAELYVLENEKTNNQKTVVRVFLT